MNVLSIIRSVFFTILMVLFLLPHEAIATEDTFQTNYDAIQTTLPTATNAYIYTNGGCEHGGNVLTLNWKISPSTPDSEVRIGVEWPDVASARTRLEGATGKASFALTYPEQSPLEVTVDFVDTGTRARARSMIVVPYPDEAVAELETKTHNVYLKGYAQAKITHCENEPKLPEEVKRAVEQEEREIDVSLEAEKEDLDQDRTYFLHAPGRSIEFIPEGLGLSSNVPAFSREDMAICIESAMYDAGVLGYSYAIVQDRNIYADSSRGAGWARAPWEDEAPSVKSDLNTRMTVASISKPITAMAVMKLVQNGDLSLDDKFYPFIQSIFPEVGEGVEDITIRELLTHSSGLTPRYCKKTAESISMDADSPKEYENVNYCVLREVIEQISGQDYEDFVQSNILKPSGMLGMSCAPDTATPTLYYADNKIGSASTVWGDYTGECGAYGWYASARDLAQVMAHFRNHTILSAQTEETMLSDCSSGRCLGLIKYGTSQGIAYGHGGTWISGGKGFRGAIMRFPRGIDAVLLMNTNKVGGTSVLKSAYDSTFSGGCTLAPEPPGPPICPDTGCGTKANGLCSKVGEYPDSTLTPLAFDPFIPQNQPDGAAEFDQYCENYPEVTDYFSGAPSYDLVCAKASLSSGGPYDICKPCGKDSKFWPGCECNPANPDSCGANLTCVPSTGYNGSTSFSTGRCWSATEGAPNWECQGNCNTVYGNTGYCYHGAFPWEVAGTPICASTLCDIGGKECAQEGLFCNTDSGQCEVECNGEIHNPDDGLYSCQGRGYGPDFACNVAAQRCFVGGVVHP